MAGAAIEVLESDDGALDKVGPGNGNDESAILVEAVRVMLDDLLVVLFAPSLLPFLSSEVTV